MNGSTHPLRIGIAGAGNAGLTAAIALAQAGHEVHVFEKHDSIGTLGAGLLLQPPGVRALRQIGVDVAASGVGMPIDRLLGHSHRGWRVVDIDYAGDGARAVNRAALGQLLWTAAQKHGVHFHFACPVLHLQQDGESAVVQHAQGTAEFDLFVVADGAASQLREQVGMAGRSRTYAWGALWGQFWVPQWAGSQQLLQRFQGTQNMMGLMPTDQGPQGVRLSLFWSIRHDHVERWRQSPIQEWTQQMRDLWPEAQALIAQITQHSDVALATYRHTWPRDLAKGPFCAVGDAAHAMSPQLGLGTTMAVLDALALAQCVQRHGAVKGATCYGRERLLPSRMFQTLSRLMTPCFQSSGPGLWRDVLFGSSLYIPGMPWFMKRSLMITGSAFDRA